LHIGLKRKPMLRPLTDIPIAAFPELMRELELKPYAAGQVLKWLYQKRAGTLGEMTDLSKKTREKLSSKFRIDALEVAEILEAKDGTKKFLCRAADGECVECVLIPADDERWTVCVSTQVGCKMACSFCRTGDMGFCRNLTCGEIISQLRIAMRTCPSLVTNVVFMGMGEPLENYESVAAAIRIFCDEQGFAMSKKRVTLSTCGLISELEKFVSEFDIKIAISLSATTDEVRNRLMPINRKYPIAEIMKFCRKYAKNTRHRVTFEYVLIGGVNDFKEDAARFVKILRGIPAKVNLIPFNPFEGSGFSAPSADTVAYWSSYIYEKGIQTNIRASRGQEILAACGQLATAATAKRSSPDQS